MSSTFKTSIKTLLSQRIGMNDIHEIIFITQQNDKKKQELYDCLFDLDDRVSTNAAWVMTNFPQHENIWLYDKQEELIDLVLKCEHPSRRRLILALLFRQPLQEPPRVDFLDFCLERMLSKKEPLGVRSLCMKLAYELCRSTPELLQELTLMLDLLKSDDAPSIRTVRKNILKAMPKGKSLQIIESFQSLKSSSS